MSEHNTARAFWIRGPGEGEIVSSELPPRGEHEVTVRARFSGISRGTESLVFRGQLSKRIIQSLQVQVLFAADQQRFVERKELALGTAF